MAKTKKKTESTKKKSTAARKATKAKRATGGKKAPAAAKASRGGSAAGKTVVTVDRRKEAERRDSTDRRTKEEPVAVERRTLQRRAKVTRRRQIDPTTCERDYSVEEIEFMSALDEYKRKSGRMFPTCSEILEVFKGLGYQKPAEGEPAAVVPDQPNTTDEQAEDPTAECPPIQLEELAEPAEACIA